MKGFTRTHIVVAATLLAVSVFALPALADTQGVSGCNNCDGYTFQADLTSKGNNNYSLSYTITDVSGAAANPQSWSLTLFNNNDNIGSTFTNFTMSDGNQNAYTVNIGKSSNNSGGGNCNSTISNAICVLYNGSSAASTIGAPGSKNNTLTFTFDFSCTNCVELANWIFLSTGGCVTGSGNCYAPSTTGTPVGVPEPTTPMLLAFSLLAALGMMAFPRVRNLVLSAPQSGLPTLDRV